MYGAYYVGWNNYLLGSKLMVENESDRNENEVAQFKTQCDQISQALRERIYPPSYYGRSWPADVLPCVASLSLHDALFEPLYGIVVNDWIQGVKDNLDGNGLIPHEANAETGRPLEGARGSSQSLMLVFLGTINPDFAREQFELFQVKFVESKMGLMGVREYPKGVEGKEDIDSGPVLFEMGAAATIVGMQTLALYNGHNSIRIRNAIEAFGVPTENKNRKRYLFGVLPIADAFIVWGHTAISPKTESKNIWFGTFHAISFIVTAILSSILWLLWRTFR